MKMNYFVIGTNDKDASTRFYDAVFQEFGIDQVMSNDRMTYWQSENFAFAVAIPFDEQPATRGNGSMVGFALGSKDAVRRLHSKVIELGGKCDGEPGDRGPMFSAYVRDLDDNKLCFSA
ncbi:VOC family protein [Maricaulis sp.]|uniref:VOC family protein n=1 Tax=Maricaulis sp. TaxID=1486257 RepID=UPI002B26FD95|nr:VOC family protein [Maricaulis sp.]